MGLRPRARVELRYNNYGGVFEQLARYTIKYQESNLPLGLYSPLTSANNRILNLLTLLLYSILTLSSSPNKSNSNGFYRRSWTCLGWNKNKVNSVWVMFWYY